MRVATTEHGATGRNQRRTFHTLNDLPSTPWPQPVGRSHDTPLNCFNLTVSLPSPLFHLPSPLSGLSPFPSVPSAKSAVVPQSRGLVVPWSLCSIFDKVSLCFFPLSC